MNKLFLDFETFYDVGYSLTKMSTVEYVQSDEFLVWGVGIKWEDEPTEWIPPQDIEDFFAQIPWEETALVCHNALFDAYILTQVYNVCPAFYYDTAAMSRGLYPNESASLKNVCERLFPDNKSMRKGEELVTAKGNRYKHTLPKRLRWSSLNSEKVIGRFKSDVEPNSSELKSAIERALTN